MTPKRKLHPQSEATSETPLAKQSKVSVTKIVDFKRVFEENIDQPPINVLVTILNSRPDHPMKCDWMIGDDSGKAVMLIWKNYDEIWEKFAGHFAVPIISELTKIYTFYSIEAVKINLHTLMLCITPLFLWLWPTFSLSNY
jgi:hypothetical protein